MGMPGKKGGWGCRERCTGMPGELVRGSRGPPQGPARQPRDPKKRISPSPRRGPALLKKWPTLYGKTHDTRTAPIANPVPEIHVSDPERLHHPRPPKWGRRVCVKARVISPLLLPALGGDPRPWEGRSSRRRCALRLPGTAPRRCQKVSGVLPPRGAVVTPLAAVWGPSRPTRDTRLLSSMLARSPFWGWWDEALGPPPAPKEICPPWYRSGAAATEVRGPFGPRHRWSLWTVGC